MFPAEFHSLATTCPLCDERKRGYAQGVPLIPKGALSSKRAAAVAVIISFAGLLVIPVITVPAMIAAGFGWRSAPRWTRLSLIIGAVVFAVYVLGIKTHPTARH